MPDPLIVGARASREGRLHTQEAAQEGSKAREQASRSQGGPDTRTVTEDARRPTITLKSGAVVDARKAAAVWRELDAMLTVDPDEFRSLLALAQGRLGDADPQHFESLWADDFLEMDRRTIQPEVQEVLLNSYEETREGPVITPLRLQSEADRPIAEEALRQCDQWVRDFLSGKDDQERSLE